MIKSSWGSEQRPFAHVYPHAGLMQEVFNNNGGMTCGAVWVNG